MRAFLALWGREWTACFLSPVAYVVMMLFWVVTGGTFLVGVRNHVGTNEPLTGLLFGATALWLTVLITVVCARMFAEERRSGTLETLLTAPVSETQVVLGKFFGAITFLCIVTTPVVSFLYILRAMSPGITAIDIGGVAGGYLIIILISLFCTALGMVISLLTRSHIVSFIAILSALWAVLLFGNVASAFPWNMSALSMDAFSVLTHVDRFAQGVVDTDAVLGYITGTVFFVFLAIKLLEAIRWR